MSGISNFSFSVPDEAQRATDFAELGSILLKTLSTPQSMIKEEDVKEIEFEDPLMSSNLGDESDNDD